MNKTLGTKRAPPRIWLPKTGQTTVYQAGDDGTYQAGRRITPRFVVPGDGTVFDRSTRLMWVQSPQLIIAGAPGRVLHNQIQAARGDWANNTVYALGDLARDGAATFWVCLVAHTSAVGGSFADDRAANPTYWEQTVWTSLATNLSTPAATTWADTITNTEALDYAGYTDWRVPNTLEISSLVDHSTALIYAVFTSMIAAYWTSTTNPLVTANAWRLLQAHNYIGAVAKTTTASMTTLPVRLGR